MAAATSPMVSDPFTNGAAVAIFVFILDFKLT